MVNEDVTERLRAGEALRKSEALLRRAEQLGQTGSFEHDLATGVVYSSEEQLRLFFGDERGKGDQLEDYRALVHRDDLERVDRWRREVAETGTTVEMEHRIVRPDGSVRWLRGRTELIRSESGTPVRVLGTNTDITEHKKLEEELTRRLAQHAAVAQLSQSALQSGRQVAQLFEEAVELVVKSSGLDFADIAELLPDDTLLLRATRGWKEGLVGSARLPTNDGSLCAFTLQSGAPGVVEDFTHEKRFQVDPLILEQGIVSHLTVLIKGEARPFGTLGGGLRTPHVFSQHDLNFAQSMANVLASAIEREAAAKQVGEQRQQLQALSRQLLSAQEAERRAIARELHDDFGQVLTTIKLTLQRRERDTAESIELVDGAIARMRDLVQDLRPPLLDELGLESSLRWYFEREARRAGLGLHLALQPLAPRPLAQLETTCFRVAQEALTNIVRHAHARRVELTLREDGRQLILEVRDGGSGFDLAEARKRAVQGGSHGLLSMQERVALAGGQLEIESTPGRGTVVRARLPWAGGGAR